MINYAEKGAGLHDTIRAAGQWLRQENGIWLSSDDAAVQTIIDAYNPVVAARTSLLAIIKTERINRQQLGMTYIFPDAITGTIQMRNDQDLININGQATAALILQSQGVTSAVMEFRDQQNLTHPMTPAQMVAMGMTASRFMTALYVAKWTHDTAIATWDGISPYNITTLWP